MAVQIVKPGLTAGTIKTIPKTWDDHWFRRFIANFASGADVRNAIAGPGISITGNITSPFATISFGISQTSTEASAGVVPINIFYVPGNVFRYYTLAQIAQTQAFSATPTLDCSAAINNAVKGTTGDVFFPTGIHYINAPIYIPATALANVRFVGESRTNSQIQPMANNISDALKINSMIINQAANEKFSMWRIRLTTGGAPSLQTAWAGFGLHGAQAGAWSASVNYVAGAIVSSGGNFYVCIAANINNVPPNAGFWTLCGTNAAGYTAAGCQFIFSGSIEDSWFDAGGVQPFFVGGLNNYHVVNNTFEFQKGCFSITGGTADTHFISNSISNSFDYFLQMTMSPNANIIRVDGLNVYTHNRGVLLQVAGAFDFQASGINLQASTGGSNLGGIGIATFTSCVDFQLTHCNLISNSTFGTGATANVVSINGCSGQISASVFDGCDVGILVTGSTANKLTIDHVDIINTLTASFRVQTGTPTGVVTVSNCNWSDGNTDLVLFSNGAGLDFFVSDCRFVNAGLTAGAGARNLDITTTGEVKLSSCVIGQNSGSALAGSYISAGGAGPGGFTVNNPFFQGTPPTSISTGTQTITFDGVTGAWTPNVGGTATYTTQQGTYSINGKCVTVWGRLTINVIGTGSALVIAGLPFVNNPTFYGGGVVPFFAGAASTLTSLNFTVAPATSQITLRTLVAAAAATGAANVIQSGTDIIFTGSYQVA